MIDTAWPDLTVLARSAGEVHPYEGKNAHLFRGEEAFAPDVTGWRRWSKPSPEPRLDDAFRSLLIESILRESGIVSGLIEGLADTLLQLTPKAPLLVAILRAGVPVGSLLAHRLAEKLGERVPLIAISLFHGLGWDEVALSSAVDRYPDRPVWFVDGWTAGGGVARELHASHKRWLASGRPDFTGGTGPRLAVLCDPQGFAHARATRTDRFIPSACFTAPETLGFSRGFVTGDSGMFKVYEFSKTLIQPACLKAWNSIGDVPPVHLTGERGLERHHTTAFCPLPDGWRFFINEVVRAIINRNPREVFLRDGQRAAEESLAPVLHLCRLRRIPVHYGCSKVAAWGALAIARMKETGSELPTPVDS